MAAVLLRMALIRSPAAKTPKRQSREMRELATDRLLAMIRIGDMAIRIRARPCWRMTIWIRPDAAQIAAAMATPVASDSQNTVDSVSRLGLRSRIKALPMPQSDSMVANRMKGMARETIPN